MATAVEVRDPRSFVDPEVWDREIKLLVRDHPFDVVMAERLFGQAVAYMITAMEKWGQGLEIGCGRLVDMAVHAFILDTVNYREFCHRHFSGKFLEHVPEIEFKYDGSVERTAHIIADNGFEVDWRCGSTTSPSAHRATQAATATDGLRDTVSYGPRARLFVLWGRRVSRVGESGFLRRRGGAPARVFTLAVGHLPPESLRILMPRTSRNLAEYWDAYKPSQEDALLKLNA